MSLPPCEHIVYGPVRSRRLGRSLGINLLPDGMKVCNMNCAYCQYGWTRGAARIGQALAADRRRGRLPCRRVTKAAKPARSRPRPGGRQEHDASPEFEAIISGCVRFATDSGRLPSRSSRIDDGGWEERWNVGVIRPLHEARRGDR